LPDWYIEQGPQDFLRERYGLTAEGIYQSVKELIGKTQAPSPDKLTFASSTDRLPHGDEQGS
jgi:1-deoxy-D-xylulose-5-phosphate synthase